MLPLALHVMLCEATRPFAKLSAGRLQDQTALRWVQPRVLTISQQEAQPVNPLSVIDSTTFHARW